MKVNLKNVSALIVGHLICCDLSYALHESKYKVLYIDLDLKKIGNVKIDRLPVFPYPRDIELQSTPALHLEPKEIYCL